MGSAVVNSLTQCFSMASSVFFRGRFVVLVEQHPRKHKTDKIKIEGDLLAEVHVVERSSLPLKVKCGYHRGSIVDEVGQYRQPDVFAPQQQVTEQCAEQHPRQESVKLQVYGTENNGCDPNSGMWVAKPARKDALHTPAEQELLADGGNDRDHQEVN